MTKKQKKMLLRIVLAAAMLILLELLPVRGYVRAALYLIPYLTVGYDILIDAAKGICNGQLLDENFLMAIATVGAFVLGAAQTGDYFEAVAVMLFYQLGELFQSYAVGKSRKNIAALMDIRPDCAHMEQGGELVTVDPEEVPIGSLIVVNPGERIPLDGTVVEGISALDTKALTGESLPRDVSAGEEALSGCINLSGVLKIRTAKAYEESTVARILELVENAGANKSRSEKFISRFARVYTPAVCIAAALLAVVPPVAGLLLGGSPDWTGWLYRALTFLVASCPCALVISVPLSFFAAIGGAGRDGILIKGSNYLEALSKARIAVFDKTGTLTQGVFRVSQVKAVDVTEEQLLEYAALSECASSHPISKSLQQAWGRPVDRSRVTEIREYSGWGVTAGVDGVAVAAGNDKLMDHLGVSVVPCTEPGTVVYVSLDGRFAGHLLIRDSVRPTSAEAIRALKDLGVKECIMLTGDRAESARQVAQELGISRVCSQLLPGDKVSAVEKLLSEKGKGTLLFAGDGINDAPVLARADVGVAMGALGSDAAIEAADVVLMDDDPMKLTRAIRIARKCMAIVYQNIVFAIFVKLLCLVLVALGMAGMGLAIFADVGVMVLAVLNAIRTLISK